jgi:UDP-glucose 4-epimerase
MAPYGQSRFCGESYRGLYERLYGLSTVALCHPNVYGPRQDPLGEAGVVAIFCGWLLAGEPVRVNGDGLQTRIYIYIYIYIYVGDVVAAHLAALEHDQVGGALNIGTGREASVLDLVHALGSLRGSPLPDEHAAAPASEVACSCLDVPRATRELGWSARTSLEDGLRSTLQATREEAAISG